MCPTGCAVCNGTMCSSCLPGYGFNATASSCSACSVTNCMTCNTNTATCDKCMPSFRVLNINTTYDCESCDMYCLACDSNRK